MKPMIRGNICLNANPEGCEAVVKSWIDRVVKKAHDMENAVASSGSAKPKNVLIIGASTGYGLASRIVAAFACGANTIGVSLEREESEKKTGTPGWYNNKAFDKFAKEAGLYSLSINADAFSNETREAVIKAAKEKGIKFDQVIYSLASPVRVDPETGIMHRSVLKPIGTIFKGRSFDVITGEISEVTIEPATPPEVEATVKVMGGEDWALWIRALDKADLLSAGVITIAYSYIGPEHTSVIYRAGSIGRAKEHLEQTAHELSSYLTKLNGAAYVSVNKAVVTRASSVIPVVSMYIAALFKTMKNMGLHEDCLDQIYRLYRDRIFARGKIVLDTEGRIRMDDLEMRDDVQQKTSELFSSITEKNLATITDIEGFRHDFLEAHGFTLKDL